MNQCIIISGKKVCASKIVKINEDVYEVTDETGKTFRVTKDTIKLLHDAITTPAEQQLLID